jgi:hypothetical protein
MFDHFMGRPPSTAEMTSPAYASFVGPDPSNKIFIQDAATGMRTPAFQVSMPSSKSVEIYRILPNGAQMPLSSATFSSSEGKVKAMYNGREIKVKTDWNTYYKTFDGPGGQKLTWKISGGTGTLTELWDKQAGVKLAKAKAQESDARIDIFVPLHDDFVNLILTVGVALIKSEVKESKTGMQVLEVLGGLA